MNYYAQIESSEGWITHETTKKFISKIFEEKNLGPLASHPESQVKIQSLLTWLASEQGPEHAPPFPLVHMVTLSITKPHILARKSLWEKCILPHLLHLLSGNTSQHWQKWETSSHESGFHTPLQNVLNVLLSFLLSNRDPDTHDYIERQKHDGLSVSDVVFQNKKELRCSSMSFNQIPEVDSSNSPENGLTEESSSSPTKKEGSFDKATRFTTISGARVALLNSLFKEKTLKEARNLSKKKKFEEEKEESNENLGSFIPHSLAELIESTEGEPKNTLELLKMVNEDLQKSLLSGSWLETISKDKNIVNWKALHLTLVICFVLLSKKERNYQLFEEAGSPERLSQVFLKSMSFMTEEKMLRSLSFLIEWSSFFDSSPIVPDKTYEEIEKRDPDFLESIKFPSKPITLVCSLPIEVGLSVIAQTSSFHYQTAKMAWLKLLLETIKSNPANCYMLAESEAIQRYLGRIILTEARNIEIKNYASMIYEALLSRSTSVKGLKLLLQSFDVSCALRIYSMPSGSEELIGSLSNFQQFQEFQTNLARLLLNSFKESETAPESKQELAFYFAGHQDSGDRGSSSGVIVGPVQPGAEWGIEVDFEPVSKRSLLMNRADIIHKEMRNMSVDKRRKKNNGKWQQLERKVTDGEFDGLIKNYFTIERKEKNRDQPRNYLTQGKPEKPSKRVFQTIFMFSSEKGEHTFSVQFDPDELFFLVSLKKGKKKEREEVFLCFDSWKDVGSNHLSILFKKSDKTLKMTLNNKPLKPLKGSSFHQVGSIFSSIQLFALGTFGFVFGKDFCFGQNSSFDGFIHNFELKRPSLANDSLETILSLNCQWRSGSPKSNMWDYGEAKPRNHQEGLLLISDPNARWLARNVFCFNAIRMSDLTKRASMPGIITKLIGLLRFPNLVVQSQNFGFEEGFDESPKFLSKNLIRINEEEIENEKGEFGIDSKSPSSQLSCELILTKEEEEFEEKLEEAPRLSTLEMIETKSGAETFSHVALELILELAVDVLTREESRLWVDQRLLLSFTHTLELYVEACGLSAAIMRHINRLVLCQQTQDAKVVLFGAFFGSLDKWLSEKEPRSVEYAITSIYEIISSLQEQKEALKKIVLGPFQSLLLYMHIYCDHSYETFPMQRALKKLFQGEIHEIFGSKLPRAEGHLRNTLLQVARIVIEDSGPDPVLYWLFEHFLVAKDPENVKGLLNFFLKLSKNAGLQDVFRKDLVPFLRYKLLNMTKNEEIEAMIIDLIANIISKAPDQIKAGFLENFKKDLAKKPSGKAIKLLKELLMESNFVPNSIACIKILLRLYESVDSSSQKAIVDILLLYIQPGLFLEENVYRMAVGVANFCLEEQIIRKLLSLSVFSCHLDGSFSFKDSINKLAFLFFFPNASVAFLKILFKIIENELKTKDLPLIFLLALANIIEDSLSLGYLARIAEDGKDSHQSLLGTFLKKIDQKKILFVIWPYVDFSINEPVKFPSFQPEYFLKNGGFLRSALRISFKSLSFPQCTEVSISILQRVSKAICESQIQRKINESTSLFLEKLNKEGHLMTKFPVALGDKSNAIGGFTSSFLLKDAPCCLEKFWLEFFFCKLIGVAMSLAKKKEMKGQNEESQFKEEEEGALNKVLRSFSILVFEVMKSKGKDILKTIQHVQLVEGALNQKKRADTRLHFNKTSIIGETLQIEEEEFKIKRPRSQALENNHNLFQVDFERTLVPQNWNGFLEALEEWNLEFYWAKKVLSTKKAVDDGGVKLFEALLEQFKDFSRITGPNKLLETLVKKEEILKEKIIPKLAHPGKEIFKLVNTLSLPVIASSEKMRQTTLTASNSEPFSQSMGIPNERMNSIDELTAVNAKEKLGMKNINTLLKNYFDEETYQRRKAAKALKYVEKNELRFGYWRIDESIILGSSQNFEKSLSQFQRNLASLTAGCTSKLQRDVSMMVILNHSQSKAAQAPGNRIKKLRSRADTIGRKFFFKWVQPKKLLDYTSQAKMMKRPELVKLYELNERTQRQQKFESSTISETSTLIKQMTGNSESFFSCEDQESSLKKLPNPKSSFNLQHQLALEQCKNPHSIEQFPINGGKLSQDSKDKSMGSDLSLVKVDSGNLDTSQSFSRSSEMLLNPSQTNSPKSRGWNRTLSSQKVSFSPKNFNKSALDMPNLLKNKEMEARRHRWLKEAHHKHFNSPERKFSFQKTKHSSSARFLCELITIKGGVYGELLIGEKDMLFFSTKKKRSEEDYPFGTLPDDQRFIEMEKQISYEEIRFILSKRFCLMNQALEIYTSQNCSYFLNFFTESLANKVIANLQGRKLRIITAKDRRTEFKKTGLTEKWRKREISNFEYLLHVNEWACRSHNDLNQYPVFPWVSFFGLGPEGARTQRPLDLPLGAIDPISRKSAKERYSETEEGQRGQTFPDPYNYGTVYSVSSKLLSYMIRIEPFTTLHVDLHAGKIDNRISETFCSIQDILTASLSDHQSHIELPPEYFYLPDLFRTQNRDFLLSINDNEDLPDMSFPECFPPSQTTPENFILKHRADLESESVSKSISSWIDLVFGVNQYGKKAKEKLNVFPPYLYEQWLLEHFGPTEMNKKHPDFAQAAKMCLWYGQVPFQLFKDPHPKRVPLEKKNKDFFEELATGPTNGECKWGMIEGNLNYKVVKLFLIRDSVHMVSDKNVIYTFK